MRIKTFLLESQADDLPDAVRIGLNECDTDVPGIIGIQMPTFVGTVEEYEMMSYIFYYDDNNTTGMAVLPRPSIDWFHHSDKGQMEALARRVARDRIDGIRYNRLFVALYRQNNPVPESVKLEHDYFITITDSDIRKSVVIEGISED